MDVVAHHHGRARRKNRGKHATMSRRFLMGVLISSRISCAVAFLSTVILVVSLIFVVTAVGEAESCLQADAGSDISIATRRHGHGRPGAPFFHVRNTTCGYQSPPPPCDLPPLRPAPARTHARPGCPRPWPCTPCTRRPMVAGCAAESTARDKRIVRSALPHSQPQRPPSIIFQSRFRPYLATRAQRAYPGQRRPPSLLPFSQRHISLTRH